MRQNSNTAVTEEREENVEHESIGVKIKKKISFQVKNPFKRKDKEKSEVANTSTASNFVQKSKRRLSALLGSIFSRTNKKTEYNEQEQEQHPETCFDTFSPDGKRQIFLKNPDPSAENQSPSTMTLDRLENDADTVGFQSRIQHFHDESPDGNGRNIPSVLLSRKNSTDVRNRLQTKDSADINLNNSERWLLPSSAMAPEPQKVQVQQPPNALPVPISSSSSARKKRTSLKTEQKLSRRSAKLKIAALSPDANVNKRRRSAKMSANKKNKQKQQKRTSTSLNHQQISKNRQSVGAATGSTIVKRSSVTNERQSVGATNRSKFVKRRSLEDPAFHILKKSPERRARENNEAKFKKQSSLRSKSQNNEHRKKRTMRNPMHHGHKLKKQSTTSSKHHQGNASKQHSSRQQKQGKQSSSRSMLQRSAKANVNKPQRSSNNSSASKHSRHASSGQRSSTRVHEKPVRVGRPQRPVGQSKSS